MSRRLLALLLICLSLALRPAAQGDASAYLLAQTNSLRGTRGLPAYTPHPALNAAAANHARWLAGNNRLSHYQEDGAGPRARAVNAGFPSSWVSENIYLGSSAGAQSAWNWWLNSEIHFAGLVSPQYDMVGIGSAAAGGRTAFVMLFGNSGAGRAPASGAGAPAPARRSFVLGYDEVGNIKHEVQPGQTLGDIALIYGYTWDDIDAMLALNGMTRADQRRLQPGSVFLVPPPAGTYTPTSPPPSATATVSPAATSPAALPSATAVSAAPSVMPTRPLRIAPLASPPPTGQRAAVAQSGSLLLLGAAIVLQAAILGGTALLWLGRVLASARR